MQTVTWFSHGMFPTTRQGQSAEDYERIREFDRMRRARLVKQNRRRDAFASWLKKYHSKKGETQ